MTIRDSYFTSESTARQSPLIALEMVPPTGGLKWVGFDLQNLPFFAIIFIIFNLIALEIVPPTGGLKRVGFVWQNIFNSTKSPFFLLSYS